MSVSPLSPGIKLFFQVGNFFIMDSEQLVSNPFQEMQNEAIGDYQKKTSLTEKFTGVKNNVCENHFNIAKSQLEREKNIKLRRLHENSSRLRYEVKLMDLDKRKHEIEMKKRIEPRKDFTYDDSQLIKTERRLGANIESTYLDKKLRYPVRMKATADLVITPAVAKARKTLKEQQEMKKIGMDSERVLTAKTDSSGFTMNSDNVREHRLRQQRIATRSAPLTTRSYSSSQVRSQASNSRFPDIRCSFENNHSTSGQQKVPPHQHVKFTFENPYKILTTDHDEYLHRSLTFYSGMNRRPTFHVESSDDDDDYFPAEKIDLQALLFGKNNPKHREDCVSVRSHQLSHYIASPTSHIFTPMPHKHGNVPKQQTQELLRREKKQIQEKISTFLKGLKTEAPIKKRESYDSDDDIIEDGNTIPIIRSKKSPTPPPPPAKEKKSDNKESTDNSTQENEKDEASTVSEKEKFNPKEAWKYIRGHTKDGSLRGTYTPADLVLQQLTGVLIGHSKRQTVPLHAASRAMRHTATFKMRKVVENLIENRTRYEQHEVDELRRKMETGDPNEASKTTEESFPDMET